MSRLDSMLRRLTAQRDGLNWAAQQIADLAGDAMDMGLGNGRTYDHLREILPDRRIWVIDRVLQCHPSCVPPEQDFLQGEAEPMLQRLAAEGHKIVLAHYDFGFGVKEKDVAEAAAMSPVIASVMAPGGIIVSGQPLVGFEELDGPEGIPEGRYMFYRA
ncbi:class I SAM-dependent methyltransferase [Phaeobacter gallaeciensis]|uniref:class I SAM-dependent methyltransferase n=1 Tax=Phaeobacter gallaeciensis TaxID=60890 RepID=UPI00237F7F8F|nr:class I SAM-dependent methyltransferase [Phaeobacter gallaeciensis]MDE4190225.1 class I SAM-dependent methyltransferase [Phaeobacter gallaeciensis]MDE4198282.1 class I SAM-dependent methyltransferase [Phaeobacter gallaeciensis]MDE4202425.1 class I SAM-dependent methyltransferase [Phaeobacter gallaeciensis]MDE4206276.1 class I SAM-dependent methyltransferase [Phaeobacter gallaeciensis]MDE4214644.1 class I SAM-dependent methyltransferase [Phaeobacter gallaeciensis]